MREKRRGARAEGERAQPLHHTFMVQTFIYPLHHRSVVRGGAVGEERVCPRCGAPYSYVERRESKGGRVYNYAVHYYYRDGKRKVKRCYLGPDAYEYVSRLHSKEGLTLRGMVDGERALAYLDALINYVRSVELSPGLRQRLAERFERLARILREGGEGGEA